MKNQKKTNIQFFSLFVKLLISFAIILVLFVSKNNLCAQDHANIDSEKMRSAAKAATFNTLHKGKLDKNSRNEYWKIIVDQPGSLTIHDSIIKSTTVMNNTGYYWVSLYCERNESLGKYMRISYFKREYPNQSGIKLGVLPGTYYIHFSWLDVNCTYSLKPEFQAVNESEMQNNEKEVAWQLDLNQNNTGSVSFWDPKIDDWDSEDWWVINIEQAGRLDINLDELPLNEDSYINKRTSYHIRNFELFSEDLKTKLSTGYPWSTNLKTNVLPGIYYIKINYTNPLYTAVKVRHCFYNLIPEFTEVPRDFEINDKPEFSQDLPLNLENNGNIGFWNPEINNYDMEDWYRLNIDQAGILNIKTKTIPPFNNTYNVFLWLAEDAENMGNISLAHSLKIIPSWDGQIIKRALLPGIYYVQVKSELSPSNFQRNGKGVYALTAKFAPVPEDIENNNSIELAQQFVLNGENRGNLGFFNPENKMKNGYDKLDLEDWWQINISQAGELILDFSTPEISGNNKNLKCDFHLYDPDGKTLIYYSGNSSRQVTTGLLPGIYYLYIKSTGNKGNSVGAGGGTYLNCKEPGYFTVVSQFNPASVSEGGTNQTRSSARQIALNTTYEDLIGYWNPDNDQQNKINKTDYYTFSISEPGELKVNCEILNNDPFTPSLGFHSYVDRGGNAFPIGDWRISTASSSNGSTWETNKIQGQPGTYYFFVSAGNKQFASYAFNLEYKSEQEIRQSGNQSGPDVTLQNGNQLTPPDIVNMINNAPCSKVQGAIAQWNSSTNQVDCTCIDKDYKWDANLEKCIPILNNSNPIQTTNSEEHCRHEYCPECDNVIVIMGIATDEDCQKCLDKNKDLIDECMHGNAQNSSHNNQHSIDDILANSDCSEWPNTEPKWDPDIEEPYCDCIDGYQWDEIYTKCISIQNNLLAQTDCSHYPNSEATIDPVSKEVICECKPGYEWNDDETACISMLLSQLDDYDCSHYPNTHPIIDQATNEVFCDCLPGYKWRNDLKGCEQINNQQQTPLDCSHIANTEALLDPTSNTYYCECQAGFEWNSDKTNCIAISTVKIENYSCDKFPNTIPVLDPVANKVYCECIPGYQWNRNRTACERIQKKPSVNWGNVLTVAMGAMDVYNAYNGNNNSTSSSGYGSTGGSGASSSSNAPPVHHNSNCDSQQKAGGDAPEVHTINLGQSYGSFVFNYDVKQIKDQIIIQQGSKVIFNTGCISGTGSIPVKLSGYGSKISVRVNPNCSGGTSGTAWNFTVICPK